MKHIATFCLLFFAANSFAQTAPEAIVTSGTKQHIRIPGTSMSVVVPSDYVSSADFTGVENKAQHKQIRVEENHRMSYNERLAALEKNLDQKHVKITESREVTFNGFKGKVITSEFFGKIGSCFLIFGDETFYVEIGGTYQLSDGQAAREVRDAVLTSVYLK
jgi:hypothetical protein